MAFFCYTWGMRVRRRLTPIERSHGQLPKLLTSDIIFIRHKRNIFRGLLRRVLGSYWDHTAMVLYPKNVTKGRRFTVVVESMWPAFGSLFGARGVALHKLDKYLMDPGRYDIGIKRVTDLTHQERLRVRLFMLMNVDAPYWRWRYLDIFVAAFSTRFRAYVLSRQRFACSSLIQKAFYDAMDWQRKPDVVFKIGVWSPIELLELTTPADLATSEKSAWIYHQR